MPPSNFPHRSGIVRAAGLRTQADGLWNGQDLENSGATGINRGCREMRVSPSRFVFASFLQETLMLKYLVNRRLATWNRASRDGGRQRLASRPSSLQSYRPLVEVLEYRTVLSFIAAHSYAAGNAGT